MKIAAKELKENFLFKDTVTVVRAALKDGRWVYLLINNRAGGNAPLIASEIVKHLDL